MYKTALTFFLALLLSFPSHCETVHLATGEYEPWTGTQLPKMGFFTEILSLVFDRMDSDTDIQFYPWPRAEKLVRSGEVFAAFPYVENTERLQHSDFSEPVAMSVGRLFYNKQANPDGFPFQTLADLDGRTVVGVAGYWYESDFKEAGVHAHYVTKETQLLDLLQRNRYELAPMDELQGWTLIRKQMPEKISHFAVLPKPMNLDPMRLMVSRSYPNAQVLLEQFNQALAHIKSDGSYAEVLKRYGLQDISF